MAAPHAEQGVLTCASTCYRLDLGDAPCRRGPSRRAEAGPGGTRLKDIASLQGAYSVPLIGYGLVVGLNKTGDKQQTIFPAQTLANMLERFGVAVPGGQFKIENIAAVLVTAELPHYARAGTRLDVTASSIGDARSLQGGVLLPTPLRGPDGQIRASAQGPLSLGGFGGGTGGNNVQVNHLTVGRVPGRRRWSKRWPRPPGRRPMRSRSRSRIPTSSAPSRVARAINAELGPGTAHALDAGDGRRARARRISRRRCPR